MEVIVKKIVQLVLLLAIVNAKAQCSFVYKYETLCDTNNVFHYYTLCTPVPGRILELDPADPKIRIYTYFETKDKFKYYLDGKLAKEKNVNTMATKKIDGRVKLHIEMYTYDYPVGKDSVLFRLETESSGCLETWIKPDYKAVYLTYPAQNLNDEEGWAVEHANVYFSPSSFFLASTFVK